MLCVALLLSVSFLLAWPFLSAGISGKLKSYSSVAKFLKDVKNILQNCREYNEEVEGEQGQAEFIELSNEMETQAEELCSKVRAARAENLPPAPCPLPLAPRTLACLLSFSRCFLRRSEKRDSFCLRAWLLRLSLARRRLGRRRSRRCSRRVGGGAAAERPAAGGQCKRSGARAAAWSERVRGHC